VALSARWERRYRKSVASVPNSLVHPVRTVMVRCDEGRQRTSESRGFKMS
jgi:hypothetical protein